MFRGVGMRFEMLGVKFGITNILTAFTKNDEKYHIIFTLNMSCTIPN